MSKLAYLKKYKTVPVYVRSENFTVKRTTIGHPWKIGKRWLILVEGLLGKVANVNDIKIASHDEEKL